MTLRFCRRGKRVRFLWWMVISDSLEYVPGDSLSNSRLQSSLKRIGRSRDSPYRTPISWKAFRLFGIGVNWYSLSSGSIHNSWGCSPSWCNLHWVWEGRDPPIECWDDCARRGYYVSGGLHYFSQIYLLSSLLAIWLLTRMQVSNDRFSVSSLWIVSNCSWFTCSRFNISNWCCLIWSSISAMCGF